MEVILLEKIQNLGGLGDRVKVKSGYARNYLVPQGKALTATEANVAVFESRRAELEAQAATEMGAAQVRARSLEAIELRIERKVNAGRLFGSVSALDVVEALAAAGAQVKRSEVRLPEGPIRQTGNFEILVRVHPDVDATVRLAVVSEFGEEEEEEESIMAASGEVEEEAGEDEEEGEGEGRSEP
jgi:large subunit ribosomal protein L9